MNVGTALFGYDDYCPINRWTANVGGTDVWNVDNPEQPVLLTHLQSDYSSPSFPFPLAKDVRQRVRDIYDTIPTGLDLIDPSYPAFYGELLRKGVSEANFPLNTVLGTPGWQPVQGVFASQYTDNTQGLRLDSFKQGCREILVVSRLGSYVGGLEFWDITDPKDISLITIWSGANYYLQKVLGHPDRQYEKLDPNNPGDAVLIDTISRLHLADQFPNGIPAYAFGTNFLEFGGANSAIFGKSYNDGDRLFYLSPQYAFILDIEDLNNIKIVSQLEDSLLFEQYATSIVGFHSIEEYKTKDGKLHAVTCQEVQPREVTTESGTRIVSGGISIWDLSDECHPRLTATFQTAEQAGVAPIPPDEDGTLWIKDADLWFSPQVVFPMDIFISKVPDGFSHAVSIGKVKGKTYAYVKLVSGFIIVVDINDPYNPFEVARFDYAPIGDNPNISWSRADVGLSVYKDKKLVSAVGTNNMYTFKEKRTCKKKAKPTRQEPKAYDLPVEVKPLKSGHLWGPDFAKHMRELWVKAEEGDLEAKEEFMHLATEKCMEVGGKGFYCRPAK